jgi:hypothetical protein
MQEELRSVISESLSLGMGRGGFNNCSSLDIFGGVSNYQDVISLDLFKHF